MRITTFVPLYAFAAHGAYAWDHASADSVRESLQKETTLVAFLAPSTQASERLEPEWTKVNTAAVGAKLSVDCLSEPDLCASLDVVSFPTIRLYRRDGSMTRYKGPRKSKEIQKFLRRTARPAVTDLEPATSKVFVPSDNVVVIAQVPPAGTKDEVMLEERFRELAARYSDRYSFGMSRGPATDTGVVQCYNNLDGAYSRTNELEQHGSLEAFVKKCATPLIPELTRRNEGEYMQSGKSLVYYFSPSEDNRAAWVDKIRPMARKYVEFLTFVTVDSEAYPEMVTGLGVPGGAAGEGVSVSNPSVGQVFPFAGTGDALTVDAVDEFIVAISQGQVDPWDGQSKEDSEAGAAKVDAAEGGAAEGAPEAHDEL
ncbi:hypothetical protein F5X68DRAFT_263695 [Plectosphaerella plurivora]|uniref:Protein disulfide-isomerase n=1 Tax=Plectosphaerella plurivora TaxID=936078 RepID=A0A9P8V6V0_9PEZI|nr:hypothetical protein F5X68DRAFT_263695 [Plectosphaerella plurivora]